ncbi:MAG: porin family protein [Candidatus Aminicenantales bacterium]
MLSVSPAGAIYISSKGFKGGLAIANMTGYSLYYHFDARVGSVFGVYATFDLARSFSLQPEILFVEKGTKGSGTSGGVAWSDVLRLTYLEIPILARYSYIESKKLTVFGYAGPAVAVRIGATRHWEWGNESGTEDIANMKRMDFGLVLGEAVEMLSGRNIATIDVRYTMGLGNCFIKESPLDPPVKNGALQVLVGLGF